MKKIKLSDCGKKVSTMHPRGHKIRETVQMVIVGPRGEMRIFEQFDMDRPVPEYMLDEQCEAIRTFMEMGNE